MDVLEVEFQRSLRARDFERATVALEKWSRLSGMDEANAIFWKASLLDLKGEFAAAISELSNFIASGKDNRGLCLIGRAGMYLDQNELMKSLFDYREILNDKKEHIVTGFHSSAQFRTAYILARLGDREFESTIQKIAPEYVEWIIDKILTVDHLRSIYEKTRGGR